MKTKLASLTKAQRALLERCIAAASVLRLVSPYAAHNFTRRAIAAFKRNLAEPGDCANDLPMLAALAVAQAKVGIRPGWIPEVQRIAYAIVTAPGF